MVRNINNELVTLKLNVDSDIEEARANTAFSKEPETIEWIDSFMSGTEVLFDVGANIGIFSLYAAVRHGMTVYAFEPAGQNFYKLCKNIIENGFQNSIVPLSVAVSSKIDFVPLHLSSIEVGSASHSIGDEIAQKESSANNFYHIIATTTLDYLLQNNIVKKPNHIKIDVDGHENSVVDGMTTTLADPTLKSILIEFDRNLANANKIHTQLKNYGFTDSHPINKAENHSRNRRIASGNGHIENVVYTR